MNWRSWKRKFSRAWRNCGRCWREKRQETRFLEKRQETRFLEKTGFLWYGDVGVSWYRVELSKVVEVNPKYKAASSADLMCPVAFVPMAAVSEETCRIEDEQERPLGEVLKGYTPFRRDDVIVAKITPCFENGKVALVSTKHDWGFGSTEFHVLRADKRRILPKYLYHLVRSNNIRLMGVQRMTGSAGQKRVPKAFWEQLQIPLPALSEQKRIAAILDKADALRAKRRAALAKLDTLLQATFLDMFGDPVTNPMGWPIAKLGNLTSHIGSGVTPRGGSSVYKSDGYLFIRSQNVLMFDFDFSDIAYIDQETHDHMQRSKVRNKDVLLNITGASIGRLNYFTGQDGSANVNQHVCIIRPKLQRILSPYLTYHLGMSNYQSKILGQNAGATRQAFNYRQIREFQIMLPPIDRQQFFSDMVNKFRQLHNNHMIGLSKLNHLFYSLQHHAFKGEL